MLVNVFAESDRFSAVNSTVCTLMVRSQSYTVHLVICWVTCCHFFPQMSLWCPRWCRRPTAGVWRSVLTDALWTWTRPSTNTMTSAHTPAPCWTLSSDQRISLPKLIHKQFIEAMGMISNIFIKALTGGEMF